MKQIELLYQRVESLELQNQELVMQIEVSKVQARGLLARQELKERKVKMIAHKLEQHMKNALNMRQEDVNRVTKLTRDELDQLRELERDLEQELKRQQDEFDPRLASLVKSLSLSTETATESAGKDATCSSRLDIQL